VLEVRHEVWILIEDREGPTDQVIRDPLLGKIVSWI
jgi:hypothetical protein